MGAEPLRGRGGEAGGLDGTEGLAPGESGGGGPIADWDDLGPEFLAYLAARDSARHVVHTGKALDRWRGFLEGRGVTQLREVATADVAAFAPWRHAQKYRGKPVGAPGCNRDLAALKALFSWALLTERLTSNPAAKVKPARENQGTRGIVIVQTEHFEKVMAQLAPKWADVSVALLGTGMRWGSLVALDPAQDLDPVRRAVVLRRPKGKRAVELVVSERCFGALQRVAGKVAADRRSFYTGAAVACRTAGVPRWTAHMLRHTFAVACIRRNANPRDVQQWLGHAGLATTEKYLRFAKAGPPPAPV